VRKKQEERGSPQTPKTPNFLEISIRFLEYIVKPILYTSSKKDGVLGFWVKPSFPPTCFHFNSIGVTIVLG
jgi:hypothetical protein